MSDIVFVFQRVYGVVRKKLLPEKDAMNRSKKIFVTVDDSKASM